MKKSSFISGFLYGLVSMVIIPLILFYLSITLHLAAYENPITQLFGIILITIGGVILLLCVRTFKRIGKGSPWPSDPPKRLVTSGIYKYSRNPQFVASAMIWLGEFLFFGQYVLFFYSLAWIVFNHLVLIFYDERMLINKYGREYINYAKSTPRYIPLLK